MKILTTILLISLTVSGYSQINTIKVQGVDTAAMLLPYKFNYPRQAISLTTTGSSGAATYNNVSGVLNIPNYSDDLSGYVTLSTEQTISGQKNFSDTLVLLNKPIRIETTDNADVSLLDTKVSGVTFPWLRITGTSTTSKIIMGSNNSGNLADMFRIAVGYVDTIWTGQYRPLHIKTYGYLSLDAAYGDNVETQPIRFNNYTGLMAVFDNAGSFLVNNPMSLGKLTAPNASALLDMTSTTKGLLLPRMTKAERDLITQVAGLAIYQTDNTPGLRVSNGTNWMRFTETID